MPSTEVNMDGYTLEEWMRLVDQRVMNRIMVSVHDLADAPFWDYWSSGYSPEDAAEDVMNSDDLVQAFGGADYLAG